MFATPPVTFSWFAATSRSTRSTNLVIIAENSLKFATVASTSLRLEAMSTRRSSVMMRTLSTIVRRRSSPSGPPSD